ncbi:MAG: nucleotide-binding protein [Polyangiaceae bacterium]|nr:nucleotide-binding protein [Polyangiaceae bacterium]
MSGKRKIFIGASEEGLAVAEHLRKELERHAGCAIWTRGVLGLAGGTFRKFMSIVRDFDLAVLVVMPGDVASKRLPGRLSARDALLLEIGVFVGALGDGRVFVLHDRDAPIDLPAELPGVTTAGFTPRIRGNLKAALEPPLVRLRSALVAAQIPDAAAIPPPASSSPWALLDKLSTDLGPSGVALRDDTERGRRRAGLPRATPRRTSAPPTLPDGSAPVDPAPPSARAGKR